MKNVQEMHAELSDLSRAVKHLLAEKGDRPWSPNDKFIFDRLMDQSQDLEERIDARLMPSPRLGAASLAFEGFDIFLRKGWSEMTAREQTLIQNTMSTSTSAQGGYTVQLPVARQFVSLMKSWGFMRQVAGQLITTKGGDMTVPTSDGTAELGEQLTQNTTATALDPSFAVRAIPVYKTSSKVITVPIELLQDAAFDIVSFVNQRCVERIGRTQNPLFTTGTGSGEPTGLVTAASVGKTGIAGQTTTIIYDDLVDMIESVDEGNLLDFQADPMDRQTGPGWMFSQALRKVIRKIKDTAGRPIWQPSFETGVQALAPAQLLGYPVFINNSMPAPAANAKSLAFGNLKRYVIRDALEVTLLRFDDSAFVTKGQVGFLAIARSGGNLLDINAVTVYQHSAT